MQPAPDLFQMYKQAQALLDAGDLRHAADLCKHMLDIDPGYAYGYYLMSALFRATGDREKCLNFAQMAVDRSPSEASFHMQLGLALFDMARWQDAGAAFRKSGDLNPLNTMAVLLCADCLSQQERFDEALAIFARARAMEDLPEVDEHEGLCLVHKGDTASAELLFDRLIARRPDYDWGYIHKGKLHESRHQYDEALRCYNQALGCNPGSQEAHECMARVRQRRQLMDLPPASATQH